MFVKFADVKNKLTSKTQKFEIIGPLMGVVHKKQVFIG